MVFHWLGIYFATIFKRERLDSTYTYCQQGLTYLFRQKMGDSQICF